MAAAVPADLPSDLERDLQGTVFFKMSGSGNDFVMLDGRYQSPDAWPANAIRAVCDATRGVGADGLVFVSPGSGPNTALMTYFNHDGSPAPMCGNAALCSTWLARQVEIVTSDEFELETGTGTYRVRHVGPTRAAMRLGSLSRPQSVPGLQLAAGEHQAALVTVGVPHLIVRVDDLDAEGLMDRGRELRFDPAAGPEGANISFISRQAAPGESVPMRTYERGVEAETLACGTGAVAAALSLRTWDLGTLPATFLTRSRKLLRVSAQETSSGFTEVHLEGESRLLFRGILEQVTP